MEMSLDISKLTRKQIMCKHLTFILSIAVSLLVVGCQPIAEPSGATPVELSHLNLAISEEPSTLDPHRTSEQEAQEIFQYACETLVYQGLDLADHPLLAESWEVAEDGLSVTITLRHDITFHDGTLLDANAVKFTFERLQQPESVESPIYDDFQNIQIETPDERTVIFKFEDPTYDFVTTLRNPYAVIISPTAVQDDETAFGRNPVCTGPYQVAEWNATQNIVMVRNPDYRWSPDYYDNREAALIDEIRISFVSEHDTRYLALLNGEVDILSLSTPEEVAEIRESGQFNIYESWVGGISYFGFNYQRAPTDELTVRQALAHAIDKAAIINAILPGMAEPAFAPLAPSIFGFSPELAEFEYQYDPDRSRQLLTEAGFVDSNGDGIVERNGEPLQMEVLTTTSSTYGKIFTLLQSQLRDVGVEVTIRPVPASEVAQITPTGEFDLLLYHYNWPYPSALELFLSTERVGASNRVAYSNSAVDNLLTKIAEQPDSSTEKQKLLVDAQVIILQDVPWQPLLVRKIVTAVNNRVQNVRVHPNGGLLLHDASIQSLEPQSE